MAIALDAWLNQSLITIGVAVLGLCGLAFSIAAQATLADAIDGVLIVLDKPFRKGDRIQLQELQTWGDVLRIGLRTTRIRTLDNRMVIVPNSKIGRGQIVNYSYPDDQYRIDVNFGVAYGTDIDAVRELSIAAVRQVDLIQADRPIDVLVDSLEDNGVRFRLRCWIDSYVDFRRARDRVQTQLYHALQLARIESPIAVSSVRLQTDEQTHHWAAADSDCGAAFGALEDRL